LFNRWETKCFNLRSAITT